MRPLLFLAADYANITGDGKLNVMGIFVDRLVELKEGTDNESKQS